MAMEEVTSPGGILTLDHALVVLARTTAVINYAEVCQTFSLVESLSSMMRMMYYSCSYSSVPIPCRAEPVRIRIYIRIRTSAYI